MSVTDCLQTLVDEGSLKSFDYAEGIPEGPDSDMRKTDRLALTFSNGRKMVLSTFCSGINEDSSLFVELFMRLEESLSKDSHNATGATLGNTLGTRFAEPLCDI